MCDGQENSYTEQMPGKPGGCRPPHLPQPLGKHQVTPSTHSLKGKDPARRNSAQIQLGPPPDGHPQPSRCLSGAPPSKLWWLPAPQEHTRSLPLAAALASEQRPGCTQPTPPAANIKAQGTPTCFVFFRDARVRCSDTLQKPAAT